MKTIQLLIFSIFFWQITDAQFKPETLQIKTDAKVDSIGNAIFTMSGKLTASQWIAWNYMYGGGQASMVKRTIERAASPYYVYDFKYSPNEMDRTFTIEYKAKGAVEYLGKNKWVATIGTKDIQPVKLTPNSVNYVQSEANGNAILQNNMTFTFPSETSNMDFDKDEFGNVTVKYNCPTETAVLSGDKDLKTAGYSLLGAGVLALLALIALRKKL